MDERLIPEERDLFLFSVISPVWAMAGKELSVQNAPTEMGLISASMKFTEMGANVRIAADFHRPPRSLKIRIPYFKELIGFTTDASDFKQEDGCIILSTDVSTLEISWKDKNDAH
ncbi:hypothetical protein G9F72_006415 [Clostridium estertheticum]|uniref:hypothetical protein n=1 Tax=Clostridium estertheticum TaxID=238834 RepID=UPI0013E92EC0|nr:hypothetical protein [Clostridium estertheticum]MBZ9685969.1 hypothetical protein [Clostridium estertheticum]